MRSSASTLAVFALLGLAVLAMAGSANAVRDVKVENEFLDNGHGGRDLLWWGNNWQWWNNCGWSCWNGYNGNNYRQDFNNACSAAAAAAAAGNSAAASAAAACGRKRAM
eukprot:jgi/Botrbrau1/18870/Bobra.177_2s0030.1